jgi:hypothetical protein
MVNFLASKNTGGNPALPAAMAKTSRKRAKNTRKSHILAQIPVILRIKYIYAGARQPRIFTGTAFTFLMEPDRF